MNPRNASHLTPMSRHAVHSIRRRAFTTSLRNQRRRPREARMPSWKTASISSREALAAAAAATHSAMNSADQSGTPLTTLSSSQLEELNVLRCPNSSDYSTARFQCPHCPKQFVFEEARDRHAQRHSSSSKQCPKCLWVAPNAESLRKHDAVHTGGEFWVCLCCGDEYATERYGLLHVEREPPDHLSKREDAQFSSIAELWDAFQFQTSVAGNSLVHSTTRQSAEVAARERCLRGSKAWRPHDGPMRRDDSPRAVFLNASDTLHSVSPHPVYGEAGELTASILLPLEKFVRTPGEYRMFFLSCVPREGMRFEQATYRTTIMFATSEHWQWCEDRGFLELDMHNNPILAARTNHDRSFEWKVASHMFRSETGVRTTGVIVAVAGDRLHLDDTSASHDRSLQMFDTSQIFRHRNRVFCPGCHESFQHEKAFYAHLQAPRHSSFVCPSPACDDMFVSKKTLYDHLATHFEVRPYRCRADPNCEETFKITAARTKHELVHKKDPTLHRCDVPSCTFTTRWKWNVTAHKINHHTDERPFKCSECDKSFKTASYLYAHKACHTDERPYACEADPDCNLTFKCTSTRNAHEIVHSKDMRRFDCGHCDSFSSLWRKNLLNHISLVHTDFHPFVCRLDPSSCSKPFKRRDALTAHEHLAHGRQATA